VAIDRSPLLRDFATRQHSWLNLVIGSFGWCPSCLCVPHGRYHEWLAVERNCCIPRWYHHWWQKFSETLICLRKFWNDYVRLVWLSSQARCPCVKQSSHSFAIKSQPTGLNLTPSNWVLFVISHASRIPELQAFLRLCNYYADIIPNLQQSAPILNQLRGPKFIWSLER